MQFTDASSSATALFACPLKPGAPVQPFDVQKPVIDFSISDDGLIWVLLDGNWVRSEEGSATTNMIRVLHLTPSGEVMFLQYFQPSG
jgi:tRNA (guanine-N(7)-)-methyltransferase subunit TRM82